MMKTQTGIYGKKIGYKNKCLVFEYVSENPCRTQGDCAEALKLSPMAVNRAYAAIRGGWRPQDSAVAS